MRFYRGKDLEKLDYDTIYNGDDWDIIELNVSWDSTKASEWYKEVWEKFGHLDFNFNRDQHLIDVPDSQMAYTENFCGTGMQIPIHGFTLGWPIDRDDYPLPPHNQANKELFPETLAPDFIETSLWLDKYKFGYMKDITNIFENYRLYLPTLTIHEPGGIINPHVDSRVKKMHMIIETNEENYFTFGEDHARQYLMEPAKAYIINTHIPHGTINKGKTARAHILLRIEEEEMMDLLKLEAHI